MQNIQNDYAIILCISGPLFFLTTIALGMILFVQYNKHRAELLSERKKVENGHKVLWEQKQTLESKILELENRISRLSTGAIPEFRLRWFKEITSVYYGSEVEVEIKFIYAFLRFLGYEINDIKIRVPVEVPVGRQKAAGVADWVVHGGQQRKAFLVIEAKEPNQQLNNSVQEQARSYAFALNAPFYMMTNGKEVVIFERKIDSDSRIFALNVKDLPSQWEKIEQVIGKR